MFSYGIIAKNMMTVSVNFKVSVVWTSMQAYSLSIALSVALYMVFIDTYSITRLW